jgi:small subunit ribosomal protein S8|tara:strand:- start:164 stop:562 length:399 start_codon:yes stop_codon:yes gene_type:complete
MVTDPISDLLTRLRNASMVSKPSVSVPHSNFKFDLAKLLKNEGYVSDVKVSGEGVKKSIDIDMKYSEEGMSVISGMNRLSKPGQRVYSSFDKLPRNNGGLGTVVVSTSRGLLTDSEARKRKLGGELICEVWS